MATSTQKRPVSMHTLTATSTALESSSTKQPRRQVSKETFLRWQRTYEKNYQSMMWLRAEIDDKDRSVVSTLWCVVCWEYETRIRGSKTFSWAWIKGSSNHKTSNIIDHTDSEPNKTAIMYFHRDQAKSRNEAITSYSPIAHSLLSPTPMDPDARERVKKKIDTSYVLAKEHRFFLEYAAIHELEERYGVDLGSTYKNRDSAHNFIHYIAESQRQQLRGKLSSCHFFSMLMVALQTRAK